MKALAIGSLEHALCKCIQVIFYGMASKCYFYLLSQSQDNKGDCGIDKYVKLTDRWSWVACFSTVVVEEVLNCTIAVAQNSEWKLLNKDPLLALLVAIVFKSLSAWIHVVSLVNRISEYTYSNCKLLYIACNLHHVLVCWSNGSTVEAWARKG